jgi:hypothetical protein
MIEIDIMVSKAETEIFLWLRYKYIFKIGIRHAGFRMSQVFCCDIRGRTAPGFEEEGQSEMASDPGVLHGGKLYKIEVFSNCSIVLS